jgi:hypothetical protein
MVLIVREKIDIPGDGYTEQRIDNGTVAAIGKKENIEFYVASFSQELIQRRMILNWPIGEYA